jgi:peptidoglycan hydrolase-like protein with peptidoglycan-binding domain/DNA invertase Pin-like site-specific DNA recombinase
MQRTYRVPLARAGLAGILALVILLGQAGTSIAGGTSNSTRAIAQPGASPLPQGAGYEDAGQAQRVRQLQRTLRGLGWRPGPVDGLFGPRTEAAVTRFQAAAGLAADGVVGPVTARALDHARTNPLRRGAGFATEGGSTRVKSLQRTLRRRGLNPGPVDGLFGPRTEAALARAQKRAGLPASGAVDTGTRRVLVGAGERKRPEPSPRPADDAPERTPDDRIPAQAAESGDVDGFLVILAALLCLAVGLLAGFGLGRRGRRPQPAPAPKPEPEPEPEVHAEPETAAAVPPAPEEEEEPEERVPPPVAPRDGVRAIGYVTVREEDPAKSASLQEQAVRIHALCEARGWRLLEVIRDVEPENGRGSDRPGLQHAVGRIARREASCLVVSQLEHLTHSVADLGGILDWLWRSDGRLVAIDVGLDTASPGGREATQALLSVATWERRRLGERTRRGLAAARASGKTTGRRAVEDLPALKEQIVEMRAEGMTLQAIADRLNEAGVPTLRGGERWRPSSVQAAAGYRRPPRRPTKPADAGGEEVREDA